MVALHPQTPRGPRNCTGRHQGPSGTLHLALSSKMPFSWGGQRQPSFSSSPWGRGPSLGLCLGRGRCSLRLQAPTLQTQSDACEVRRNSCASVVSMEICQPGNLTRQLGLRLKAFVFAKPFPECKH